MERIDLLLFGRQIFLAFMAWAPMWEADTGAATCLNQQTSVPMGFVQSFAGKRVELDKTNAFKIVIEKQKNADVKGLHRAMHFDVKYNL